MHAAVGHHGESERLPPGSVSIPRVSAAAVLVGVGLFGMAYWLITFEWLFFVSLLPLVAGGLLLFTGASGAESA